MRQAECPNCHQKAGRYDGICLNCGYESKERVEYQIVAMSNINHLTDMVTEMLNKDWELAGGAQFGPDGIYTQTLVRYHMDQIKSGSGPKKPKPEKMKYDWGDDHNEDIRTGNGQTKIDNNKTEIRDDVTEIKKDNFFTRLVRLGEVHPKG